LLPKGELAWHGDDELCRGAFASATIGGGIELGGRLLDKKSWQAADARVTLDTGRMRLSCLGRVAAQLGHPLPLSKLDGSATASLVVTRAPGDELPALQQLTLATTGLAIAPLANEHGEVAWLSDRLDLHLEGGTSKEARNLELNAKILDSSRGPSALPFRIARAKLAAELNVATLIDPPPLPLLLLALATTRIHASVQLDELDAHRRAALPSPLREALASVDGVLSLSAYGTGTVLDPVASARMKLAGLKPKAAGSAVTYPAIDVDLLAGYRDGTATANGWIEHLEDGRARTVATFDATVTRPTVSLFGRATRGRADAHATFSKLPLAAFPLLAERQIGGSLSGTLALEDLGGAPQLALRVEGDAVKLGRDLSLERAQIEVAPTGKNPEQVRASASFAVKGGGTLDLGGWGSLAFVGGIAPELDRTRPAALHVSTAAFPLRALQAVLPEGVTKIDGRLDGQASVAYQPGQELQLTMGLALEDGALHVPDLGQELSQITARASARPGAITIDRIAGKCATGRITGRFDARLAGLDFVDLTGRLDVAADEEIPIALQGQPLGALSGAIAVRARRIPDQDKKLAIDLTTANLKLRLPPALTGGELQGLDDHPDIATSLPLGPAPRVVDGAGAIAVTVVLKDAHVQGGPLELVVSTDPDKPIRFGTAGAISGELTFVSGKLALLGKPFEIERGTVRLSSADPTNPYVNLTARWNAPNGTIVFVDYAGVIKPIHRDKLRFRSNPPLGEDALLSLMVFGDSADQSATVGADPQQRASQAVGGVLAAEISRMVGAILPGLSAGVGATAKGYTRTTLSYQLGNGLSAQASYEQAAGFGAQGPFGGPVGTSNTTTAPSGFSDPRTKLGLDWRFHPDWSLRGTVGFGDGADSGVDLIYQYRY
jgi:translocation and assembly module TamB